MTERKPPGMSFETWVDHQISRGLERGDFAEPEGAGKPLPRRSAADDSYEWVIQKARREGVDTAAMLPPGLALRRERDGLPARVAHLASEAEVRALAEDYNARVETFWRQPQPSRWSPLPGLADVEALVEGWRLARPEPPPAPAPPPPRPTGRSWFRRRRG
jgi:hypothetical protein